MRLQSLCKFVFYPEKWPGFYLATTIGYLNIKNEITLAVLSIIEWQIKNETNAER